MMQLLMQLAEFTLKATLVVCFGAMSAWLSSRCSGAWKNRIWRLTLCGVLAIPFFMLAGDIAGRNIPTPLFQASQQPYLRPALAYPATHIPSQPLSPSPALPSHNEFDLSYLLITTYAAGIVVSMVSLAGGLLKARRVIAGAQGIQNAHLGFRPAAPLLVSERAGVPSTFGFLSPVILLPASSVDWPVDRLSAAVRHEWAHVLRRDWIWQMAARFVGAFQWFNPVIWLLHHSIKSSAEQAADEHVLASGFGAARYARELLEVAVASKPSGVVVAMVGPGGLKGRLKRILSTNSFSNPHASVRYPLLGVLGVCTLIIGVAGAHGFRHGSIASFGPGKPFYGPATLRDGSVIRLEYLQDWTVTPNRLWMPDGSAVSEAVRRNSLHVPGGSSPSPGPLRMRISTTGIHDPASWCIRVPFETSGAMYGSFGTGDGSNAIDMATVYIPSSVEQTDVKVGIGSGPWRVIETARLGQGAINPEIGTMSTKGWWNMTCKRFGPRTDGKADAPNVAGQLSEEVYVSIIVPKQYRDMQIVLKAYSSDRELPCAGSQLDVSGAGIYPDGKRQFIFAGDGAKPTRFELVGRPYEWVTFRGIKVRR